MKSTRKKRRDTQVAIQYNMKERKIELIIKETKLNKIKEEIDIYCWPTY